MKTKYIIILASLLLLPLFAGAQDWIVPEEDAALSNPVDYNLEHVKKGKDLYLLNCKSCHGDAGKNNALALVPAPPDVASELMQANSEGELYYKISVGRGGMPQFASVISEDDRWRIVNFIMNYNPDRTPLLSELPPIKATLRAVAKLEEKRIEVHAEYEMKNGELAALENTPVLFFNKKTFGRLPIGEATTNEAGMATFVLPDNLIGDEEGKLDILVHLNEDFEAEQIEVSDLALGLIKEHTPLIEKGVLWSTNDNMPLWLVIGFFGMVAGAWITIGYVVLQLFKINKAGKEA